MKDNKTVLNEAFFKKTSYSERRKSEMPGYEPAPGTSDKTFGSQSNVVSGGAFAVTDTQEMKKRLAGTFGAAFGSNNIKSMAGKAIKSFPIIVSDNIEPETVINLKRLMEEQYADYISLLISNKVIDIGDYMTASADGSTIAIQALDSISGTDFSKNRIANKAMNTGELSIDDIGANTPLYNLLRENHADLSTGDSLFDALLENALVVPNDKVNDVVKYIQENADSLILTEVDEYGNSTTVERSGQRGSRIENKAEYEADRAAHKSLMQKAADGDTAEKTESLSDALDKTITKYNLTTQKIEGYDKVLKSYTGDLGNGYYNKLSNAEILVNKGEFDNVMNRTVGELLMDPANAPIKDRFEKATILLQAEMITGSEYIDYCTLRLGIPISATTRATLTQRFRRAKNLNRSNDYKNGIFMTDADAKLIKQNQKVFDRVCPKMLNTKVGLVLAGVSAAAGGGAAAAAVIATSASLPWLWPALGAAVAGGGVYLLFKLIKGAKMKKTNNQNRIEGWERVEALIDAMDRQRADVINGKSIKNYQSTSVIDLDKDAAKLKQTDRSLANDYKNTLRKVDNPLSTDNKSDDSDRELSSAELKAIQDAVSATLRKNIALAESYIGYMDAPTFNFSTEEIDEAIKTYVDTYDECMKDDKFRAQMLEESIFRKKKTETAMPVKTRYIEKKPNKDLLIVPEFSARSQYAYGSTEIDARAMKDRKYNQPLIMTIKFKERMDDGKYSDNELTAVIGILGKVIRVPSDEMKYILTRNIEGETIEGIFKSGNIKNAISDLLSTSKINSDVKNLPQSADVWKNLEKVASLAIANKYSGKKSGNVANAHIVFSEKEIDDVRIDSGTDYKRDMKLVSQLMKRYSAFTLMIADDPAQRVYIYNDEDDISWNVVPYSAIMGKDTGDQLASALSKISRM